MRDSNKNQSHSWLKGASTTSEDVEVYYDVWAKKYNEDLKDWQYHAPIEAAKLLKSFMPGAVKILDAGCGTGLTGITLREFGYADIAGIDISRKSITLAEETGAYSSLQQQDLQKQPFPFNIDEFDAVNCIGVLTYIEDPRSLFQEFCRIVRPGGYIVFTHREDLVNSFNYPELLKELEHKNYWKNLLTSKPKPYLPKNRNFTDEIKVVYYIFQTPEEKE
jgi:predicted TPR repeat methyltransferase